MRRIAVFMSAFFAENNLENAEDNDKMETFRAVEL